MRDNYSSSLQHRIHNLCDAESSHRHRRRKHARREGGRQRSPIEIISLKYGIIWNQNYANVIKVGKVNQILEMVEGISKVVTKLKFWLKFRGSCEYCTSKCGFPDV